MAEPPPEWDEARAARLVGRKVLIGLTRVGQGGERHEQAFGRVISADRGGIGIRLEGARAGERFDLPPDLRAFHPASPGEYRLRSTGEVVADPDYICTWTIHPPSPGA